MAGQLLRDSVLVQSRYDADFLNFSTSAELTDIGRFSWSKVTRYLGLVYGVGARLLRRRHDAVVFSPSPTFPGFVKELPFYLLARWRMRQRVFWFHAKGLGRYRAHVWTRRILRTAFTGGRAIVLSHRLKPDVEEWFPDSHVHIQPCGIPDTRVARQRTSAVTRFLFLGNLIVSKGVRVLLAAADLLHTRRVEFELIIVGADSELDARGLSREIKSRGLSSVVRVIGPLYGTEKEQALADSDALIFPTFYDKEAFGLVNLEAMKYSIPVISTDNGGIADVVLDGETGFIVPMQNAEALAERMETLVRDPDLRRRLGATGRQVFEQRFTLRHYERGITSILEQVLGRADRVHTDRRP